MRTRHRLALLLLIILFASGTDQATKKVAADQLKNASVRSYAGDTFRLQYSENPGAFLSLGADLPDGLRSLVMVWGVGAFLAVLLLYGLFGSSLRPLSVIAIGMTVGGGYSNWVDRVLRDGSVVDFMNVGVGSVRSGIFNVADLFIEAGAVLLVISLLRTHETPPTPAAPQEPAYPADPVDADMEDR